MLLYRKSIGAYQLQGNIVKECLEAAWNNGINFFVSVNNHEVEDPQELTLQPGYGRGLR